MLTNGGRGVQLFFALSGFILGLPFAQHFIAGGTKPALRVYFRRRLTRLEPPYLLNVLICAALVAAVTPVSLHQLMPHIAASVFYLHSFIYGAPSPVNSVLWSLEVEVQFYCLVPLLTQVYKIRSAGVRRGVLLVAMLGAGIVVPLFHPGPRLSLSILNFLPLFLAGMLLAELFSCAVLADRQSSLLWDAVSLAGWPLVFLMPPGWMPWLLPLLILPLYTAAFRGKLTSKLFSANWITIIGGMCYTIYLFHYQIISFVGRWSSPLGRDQVFWRYFAIQVAIIAVCILALSSGYFLLVERPCMQPDWPQRLYAAIFARRRSKAASAATA